MISRQSSRLLLALAFIVGCGNRDEGPPIYPVSGKILVDGQPAGHAQIAFHQLGDTSVGEDRPFAVSEADGSFRPSTRLSFDGAPAGNYALTIVWPEVQFDQGEAITGPDKLRGRYSNPTQSAIKATIKEGDNVLPPIELNTSD